MSLARKIRCTVSSVTDHGARVYTVDLLPATPAPPFRPGQFLHLTVDTYDPSGFWPESRVFSIASSPRDRKLLRICYSVKGRYTAKMEQALRPGVEVWIKLPYGEFVIDDTAEIVLLAGGTGISAFTAFIEALKPDHAQPVSLAYGVRTPALLLFSELILAQLDRVRNFQVLFFLENGAEEVANGLAKYSRPPVCLPGRIALVALWSQVARPESRVFYLSGPPVMLSALSTGLCERQIPPEQIRTDAWE